MKAHEDPRLRPSQDQIIYANLLVIGVWLGIFLMVICYSIYVFGILPPHVNHELVTQMWGKGVDEYLEQTHSPHGWGWVDLISKGDFLNYIGFTLLALMTVVCYMVLLRGYLREKNMTFAVISLLEILVLSVVASGLIGGGGH